MCITTPSRADTAASAACSIRRTACAVRSPWAPGTRPPEDSTGTAIWPGSPALGGVGSVGVPNSVLTGLLAAYPAVAPYVTQGANGVGSVIYPGQTPRIYWDFANTQTGNIDTTYANGPSFAKSDAYGGSATLDWQIAHNMKFKSITGWRGITWNIGTDLDGTPDRFKK